MKSISLRIVAIFLVIFVTTAGCSTDKRTETTSSLTTETKPVMFCDDKFETAIKKSLGKGSEEEILAEELANIKVLSVSHKNIVDLTGIEYCINLIELDLSSNRIMDISPLNTLTNLEILNLNMNSIINISAIANLTNLKWLNIQNNDIGDIWPLAYNTGLGAGDRVFLDGNGILIIEHTGPWDVVTELVDRGVELHTSYSW